MKVLLTILFLLLLASHVVELSHPQQQAIQWVQDTPGENETGGFEEKAEEKEFLPYFLATGLEAIPYARSFSTRYLPLEASPLIETQTPPPDRA